MLTVSCDQKKLVICPDLDLISNGKTTWLIFRSASSRLPEEASQHARHGLHHCAGGG